MDFIVTHQHGVLVHRYGGCITRHHTNEHALPELLINTTRLIWWPIIFALIIVGAGFCLTVREVAF